MKEEDKKTSLVQGDPAVPIDSKSIKTREFRESVVTKIRQISPLGFRVVIKIREESNRTDTGLYLPEGAKEMMQEAVLGEVLEVASAHDEETEEDTNISGVPMGALVLVSKQAGISVPWDESLRIVETQDVLAIVNEVDLS